MNNAGIIFYRYVNNDIEFLLQERYDKKKKNLWLEDLGGKSEPSDNSIYDVAAREAAEESNGAFCNDNTIPIECKIEICKNKILDMIKKQSIAIYISKIKYIIFLVKINDTCMYDFGDREFHTKYIIDRTINWISKKELKRKSFKSIHPRIRSFYTMI